MEYHQILELVKEVAKAGLSNFEYQEGDVRIAMCCPELKTNQVVVKSENIQPAAAESLTVSEVNVQGEVVISPLVGTFYAAPSEDAEAYVKIGDTVRKGQTLAIVEAMKLMNEIESDYDGVVTEICVSNASTVEYGQPLFRIQC